MDKCELSDMLRGVTMDGVSFDFDALCSSVSKVVIMHLVTEWVTQKIIETYPPEMHNSKELFKVVLKENRNTIVEAVWDKYTQIYSNTRNNLKKVLFKNENYFLG